MVMGKEGNQIKSYFIEANHDAGGRIIKMIFTSIESGASGATGPVLGLN